MRTRLPAVVLSSLVIFAQEQQPPPAQPAPKPVLVNSGAPMRVEYQCTEEDIRAAGMGCTAEDPCEIFLELASVEFVGVKIFVIGNIHTSSSTVYSVLLASEDGGRTWTEPVEPMRFGVLDQIQFLDFETGWIGGQIVHPLPRDPFLLLTTDGGKTWKQRPVFEEGRVGAIERFWFDSRTNGSLWIDRTQSGEVESQHERYETATGGESWMLREVSSRPIGGKRGRESQNDNTRLRAEARTSSYRIEKRQEEKWQAVASFAIPLGECRPPEKPPEAPPAEPSPKPKSE